jgi:outer membrane protein assembly factor BamB
VALAGCDWVMYRANSAHTGHVQGETLLNIGNVGTLRETWSAGANVLPAPAVADGKLYVVDGVFADASLEAYDANGVDGCAGSPRQCTPLWKATIPFGQAPAVAGGVAYVSGDSLFRPGRLYAFDADGNANCGGTPRTCEPLWTAPIDASFVSPATVAGGVVFVAGITTSANRVYAFDAAGKRGCSGTPRSCTPLWSADAGPPAQSFTGDIFQRSPAVANGLVFVSGADNKVHVYDAAGNRGCEGTPKTCVELWTFDTDLPCDETFSGCGISAPVVANRVLYVMGRDFDNGGGLFAFDAGGRRACEGSPKTCSPLWTAPGVSNHSPPAIAHGIAYTVGDLAFTPGSNRLRAFDAAGIRGCSGTPKVCAPLWTSSAEVHGPAPAVANGVVYATSNDFECGDPCVVFRDIFAFDARGSVGCTGTPKHCAPLLDVESTVEAVEGFGDPVVANGVLYISDDSVHAFTLP